MKRRMQSVVAALYERRRFKNPKRETVSHFRNAERLIHPIRPISPISLNSACVAP